MQVIQLIPTKEAPRLDPKVYSDNFCKFTAACLTKNPKDVSTANLLWLFADGVSFCVQRPSIKELLKHPFVTEAGSKSLLISPKDPAGAKPDEKKKA